MTDEYDHTENWQLQELNGASLLDFTTKQAAENMRAIWERDYQRPFRVRKTT